MDEPKVREAKSSDQRALACASTRSGALVPMALRRALRLRTVKVVGKHNRRAFDPPDQMLILLIPGPFLILLHPRGRAGRCD